MNISFGCQRPFHIDVQLNITEDVAFCSVLSSMQSSDLETMFLTHAVVIMLDPWKQIRRYLFDTDIHLGIVTFE